MTEGYVQVPTDESGKKLRTWLSGSVHSEAVVLTLPDTNNTFIDPRYVTISGATVPIGATGSITGSINNWPSTYAVTESGQWRVNVTGSSSDSSVIISGSVNQLGQWQVNATGSITGSIDNWPSTYAVTQSGNWNVTGSINNTVAVSESGQWTVNVTGSQSDSSVKVSGSMNQLGQWTINVTGSQSDSSVKTSGSMNQLGQWVVYATGSGPSQAVLVTGSVYQAGDWNVTGSINNWPSTYAVTESGQWNINATGSGPSGAVLVTGSSYQAGAWNVTGSVNNWPSTYAVTESGQWSINATGSGVQPLPVSISGSINRVVSGSGIYTYASATMVTGSVNIQNAVALTTKTYKCQGISGSISANSAASILTGVANKHLKVYAILYNQSGSSANQISFFSSGSGLDNAQLLGPMPLGINEGFAHSTSPPAWILCTAITGSSLYVSSSAAAVHGGILSYYDDDAT